MCSLFYSVCFFSSRSPTVLGLRPEKYLLFVFLLLLGFQCRADEALLDFRRYGCNKLLHAHGADDIQLTVADGYQALLGLTLTNHYHVGHAVQAGIAGAERYVDAATLETDEGSASSSHSATR